MLFLAPFWLLGLALWVALTGWLLLGRRTRINVPFLRLWRAPTPTDRPRRGIQVPPIAILFALLAILLTIFAAAHPIVRGAGATNKTPISLIVDRGLSMSARGEHDLRFREVFTKAAAELRSQFGSAPVDLLFIPNGQVTRTDFEGAKNSVEQTLATAIDTKEMLGATINQRLAQTTGPVIVISDQSLPPTSRRLVEIPPQRAIEDVGIVSFAVRELPGPQVMVRVRNQSSLSAGSLIVDVGNGPIRQDLTLPARGSSRDYFVDVPKPGDVLSAELRVADDLPANNRAWLVREGSSARIEAHAPIAPELRRLIDVYQRARPRSQASAVVAVVEDISQLPADAPAILLPHMTDPIAPAPLVISAHPVTNHVEWTRLPQPVRAVGQPPDGWVSLVSSAGPVLVAVRPGPLRQVWVGFDARDWAATTDFVIFWTNVFDWVGGGSQTYVSHSIDEWSPPWRSIEPLMGQEGLWPGIYRRTDGTIRAFNDPDLALMPPAVLDWHEHLSDLPPGALGRDVSGSFVIAALACMVLCAMTWRRSNQSAQISKVSAPPALQAYA
jgi:hypothetical protein